MLKCIRKDLRSSSGIQQSLQSIAGIGAFSKNVEGKLVFEPKTEKYFKDEWYGFQKVKVKQFEKKAVDCCNGNSPMRVTMMLLKYLELEEGYQKTFQMDKLGGCCGDSRFALWIKFLSR
jgi:hypothetical protein